MFFCHSGDTWISPVFSWNWVQVKVRTQASDWCRVQGWEYRQVGVEVVHFPQPFHDLDEFHQVSLSFLQSNRVRPPEGGRTGGCGDLSIRLLEDQSSGPVGHVVKMFSKLGQIYWFLLTLFLYPSQQFSRVESQKKLGIWKENHSAMFNLKRLHHYII